MCIVTEDQTQTVSGAPSPCLVLFGFFSRFFKVCLSHGKAVTTRHPALACLILCWSSHEPLKPAVHGRSTLSSTVPQACRLRDIAAAVRDSSKPAVRGRSMPPSAAHPSPPFAGDRRRRPQFTQACHSREITAAVRGLPKTAADSGLKAAGQFPNFGQECHSLVTWIQFPNFGQECYF